MKLSKYASTRQIVLIFEIIAILIIFVLVISLLKRISILEETIKPNTVLLSRISLLEEIIKKREFADPLMPIECTLGERLGESSDRPCWVEFHRLFEAPQQFQGRWVGVAGSYVNKFETSALFSAKELHQNTPYHLALWISHCCDKKDSKEIHVVGKFKRGPSGHLGQYFGELSDAVER